VADRVGQAEGVLTRRHRPRLFEAQIISSFPAIRIADKLTSNLLLLVVTVLDTGDKDGGLVGEDETALLEVTVTGPQDSVQHALVQQEVAHPLGDDDVDLGEGKNNLLHLALKKSDLVAQAVNLDDLLCLVDDGRHVNTNDVLGAGLCGEPVYSVSALARVMCGGVARGAREHAEDTGTAANIEDNLVLEEVGVLVNGVAVASCADFILLNLLSASASGFT